ncbi:MAG: P-II family nitrogen regulator [Magnetococcales bacterium]|nr:P-II family nitrogen regulator [Magnetococcales bacterium]
MRFKLIVAIVRTNLTDRIVAAAKKAGATGATLIPARGTGIHEARTFFGLSLETQRDVVMFLLEEPICQAVLDTVREAGEFHKPGTGIAFLLDLDQVVGLESQLPGYREEHC